KRRHSSRCYHSDPLKSSKYWFRGPLLFLPKDPNRSSSNMSLVEKVITFVRFLKTDDKEYGENILHLLEASPIRESDEYGFMLWAEWALRLRHCLAPKEAQRT